MGLYEAHFHRDYYKRRKLGSLMGTTTKSVRSILQCSKYFTWGGVWEVWKLISLTKRCIFWKNFSPRFAQCSMASTLQICFLAYEDLILVSHYSQRFANFLGSNQVAVLATLIMGLSSAHRLLQSVFHLDIQCIEECGCTMQKLATHSSPPSCSACFRVSVASLRSLLFGHIEAL